MMLSRMSVLLLLLALAVPAGAQGPDNPVQEAEAAFFAGLDLREAGDCEGAIARFQLALASDPGLHQARFYMAECYHQLGMDDEAVAELTRYLAADFPGAEVEKARALMSTCGGDPDAVARDDGADGDDRTADGDAGGTVTGDDDGAGGGGVDPLPTGPGWARLRLEAGVQLAQFANRIDLVTGGPVVELRYRPIGILEVGVRGAFGMGGYPDQDGLVQVPSFGVGIWAGIPLGASHGSLLTAGAVVPLLISRYGGEARVDPGVLGELGLRVAIRGTRLVIGGQLEGGYVVTPTIGGSIRVGIQLGPLGGLR